MTGATRSAGSRRRSLLPHLAAAILALIYAYVVSQSQYVRTGLQFNAPLLVILLCHIAWIAAAGRVEPGFAQVVLRRTAQTAIGLAGVVFVVEILAPMPGEAQGLNEAVGGVLYVLVCLIVLTLIVAAVAGGIYLIYRALLFAYRAVRATGRDRPNDVGSLTVVVGLLVIASLEGLPFAYSFDGGGKSTASSKVEASPEAVWQAMQTATSPKFPLPAVLRSLPRPVAVLTDEGTDLGANRVVRFEGREGAGDLSLRVTERTPTRTHLSVRSDTSPLANWVALQFITYEVVPEGEAARVNVTVGYESRLAPAWVFVPLIDGATYFAADALARETKERAEASRLGNAGAVRDGADRLNADGEES